MKLKTIGWAGVIAILIEAILLSTGVVGFSTDAWNSANMPFLMLFVVFYVILVISVVRSKDDRVNDEDQLRMFWYAFLMCGSSLIFVPYFLTSYSSENLSEIMVDGHLRLDNFAVLLIILGLITIFKNSFTEFYRLYEKNKILPYLASKRS